MIEVVDTEEHLTAVLPDIHRVMGVVKADAYGHGVVECARALEEEGATWFGVTSTDEGLELRVRDRGGGDRQGSSSAAWRHASTGR